MLWHHYKRAVVLFIKPMMPGLYPRTVAAAAAEIHFNGNIKLRELCDEGRLRDALGMLHSTNHPIRPCTYALLLQGCIKNKALPEGKLIHAYIKESETIPDTYLLNTLLNMYVHCGALMDARKVFDEIPQRDDFSWNVMIAAYARHGIAEEAMNVFYQMQIKGTEPNQFTFASILPACAHLKALEQGMEIHEKITRGGFESDVFVGSALVDMYGKCGNMKVARELFDKMAQRDVVTWTSMIAGYAQNGRGEEALELFHEMQMMGVKPNAKTFVSVLPVCANLAALEEGVAIHEELIRRGFRSDAFLESALIDMYAKCGSIEKARELFDDTWQRDVVLWTVMITAYAQNGREEEALKLFRQMRAAGVKPNSKTFTSILPACANLAALEHGMEIHGEIIRCGFHSDAFLESTLIDMYAKCGSIQKARELFDNMHQQDIVSWTAMIAGYAMHGCSREALNLFQQMTDSGMNPDHVSLVCILSACCHAGLVDEGYQYFKSMSEDYHITPAMEHYSCMVDLLGRAGRLDEAHEFINEMPIEPDAIVWRSLLGACRIHNNLDLGEHAAAHLFELDPKNASPYVLLSNIYAAAGRWSDIVKLRKAMKDKGVQKPSGCSWIEVDKQVHIFNVGDRSHPQMQRIYAKLETLSTEMKAAGYVPDTVALNDVEE